MWADHPDAETAVRFFAGRPSPTMTQRGEAPSVLAPARSLSGRGRRCERCESGRVADRPFARHPEAPDRGGQSTRLAPPVRPALVQDQRRPGHYGGDPLPCSSGPNSPEPPKKRRAGAIPNRPDAPLSYGRYKISQVPVFIRVTRFYVGMMWSDKPMPDRPVTRLSTRCGNVYPHSPTAPDIRP